ncbi:MULTISPECIES: hypothetical protein [unclassified Bradyrhizobium]|uniref:hypothetical protein n=1 Tax=unclassified Bradyrhizobium TaxID=2631580 RepID=UPI0010295D9A|nr:MULTISPECIES: hypothetical protein [unclassified Bradyrhizobium]RZN16502.1 hypothetical protein CWO90_39575 [Bradyrhizobium sp. Leo121]TAI61526.1 hypothetical protein CWO89_34715 [Bradyrhizobium sp. Leo170]
MEHVTAQLSNVQIKVNAMHDLLMRARGVRWMMLAIAAMAGFLASLITKYLHLPLSNCAGTTTFPTALRTYGRKPVGRPFPGLKAESLHPLCRATIRYSCWAQKNLMLLQCGRVVHAAERDFVAG